MDTKRNWLIRLLYNNNPFYLISGGLILSSLLSFSATGQTAIESCLLLGLMMIGYAVAMGATAVLVVRVAKVWEDARSIYFVVILSILALSVSFDQLCNTNWFWSATFLTSGFLISILLIELMIKFSQFRLPQSFRFAIYGVFALFFFTPLLLSSQWDLLGNNGLAKVALFPVLSSVTLLAFLPTIRSGRKAFDDNGTPWNWPIFPWSIAAILLVAIVIRGNGIAVSFGPIQETSLIMNPIFWSPLILVVGYLLIEFSQVENLPTLRSGTIWTMPALLLLVPLSYGTPVHQSMILQIESSVASLPLVLGWMLIAFYGLIYFRGVHSVRFAVSGLIAVLAVATIQSPICAQLLHRGMIGTPIALVLLLAIPIFIEFWHAYNHPKESINWISMMLVASISVFAIVSFVGTITMGTTIALLVFFFACLTIGLLFNDAWAIFTRTFSGLACGAISLVTAIHYFVTVPSVSDCVPIVGATTLTSLIYWLLIRRSAWLKLVAWNSILFLVVGGTWLNSSSLGLDQTLFLQPIVLGIGCLAIGLAITSIKAGAMNVIKRWKQWRVFSNASPGF